MKTKKIVSLFLAFIMILSISVPAFAEEAVAEPISEVVSDKPENMGSELEDVIRAVRKVFDIPENTKFDSYHSYSRDGENVWNLYWRDNETDTSVNISATASGKILSYYSYEPYYTYELKLPDFSEEEALLIAKAFILSVAPEGTYERIRLRQSTNNPVMDRNYYFSFYRVENDIPYYNNNVSINVDTRTGKVTNYNYNMEDNLQFPSADAIISNDIAKDAYIEKLGLKLVYQYSYNYSKKEMNIVPVYVPKQDSYTYAIDAVTGEKINISFPYYYVGGYGAATAMDESVSKEVAMRYELTPEEQAAVDEQSMLISLKEAEKIARAIEEAGIDEGFSLTNWNLGQKWPMNKQFVYYLSFNKPVKREVTDPVKGDYYYEESLYASVSVDANTGEVLSFYSSIGYKDEPAVYDYEQSKAIVDEFLKKFSPEKYADTEFVEQDHQLYYRENPEEMPRNYGFSYTRIVNGIQFPGNNLYVSFDAVSGNITNYNANWFDVEFPALEDIIDEEDAYSVLFERIGLELQYIKVAKEVVKPEAKDLVTEAADLPVMPRPVEPAQVELKLVYTLKSDIPQIINAFTGEVLSYDLTGYKEAKAFEYKDIEGHFAEEQIKILSKYQILAFESDEFMPYMELNQKDYFMILSKLLNRYSISYYKDGMSEDEINEMYKQLLREGIVREGEKDPDQIITREDAVKYLVRLMKYDKVAEIPGIFNVQFKDADEITEGLEGYVAIAAGLKLVSGSGGYFYPGNNLTRGEVAVIIYNYLK